MSAFGCHPDVLRQVFKDHTFREGELSAGPFLAAWWSRAESLGLDILVDLQW